MAQYNMLKTSINLCYRAIQKMHTLLLSPVAGSPFDLLASVSLISPDALSWCDIQVPHNLCASPAITQRSVSF